MLFFFFIPAFPLFVMIQSYFFSTPSLPLPLPLFSFQLLGVSRSLIPSQLPPAAVRLIQTSMALPAAAYRSTERVCGVGGREGWGERGKKDIAGGDVLCSRPSRSFAFALGTTMGETEQDRWRSCDVSPFWQSFSESHRHKDRQEQYISEACWPEYFFFYYYDKWKEGREWKPCCILTVIWLQFKPASAATSCSESPARAWPHNVTSCIWFSRTRARFDKAARFDLACSCILNP